MPKRGEEMWHPIGLRGEVNGDAVRATCWTTASKKLAKYQRQHGSNYYLMHAVIYVGNETKFREVCADAPKAAAPTKVPVLSLPSEARASALARQARMMKSMHLDD